MQIEVLKSEQKEIFKRLKNFPEFYLVGGTALALQIGHRISVDFDLFSAKEISPALLPKIKRVFKEFKIKTVINHLGQLSVMANETKLDFVKYNFPLILKLIKFEEVKILPAAEIVATKAYVLNHRGTLKDYVDLYFVLKNKYTTLEKIKKIAEKKYKDEFNFRLFLEQLVYLEDVKDIEIQFLRKLISKKQMAKFFQEEIKKIKL